MFLPFPGRLHKRPGQVRTSTSGALLPHRPRADDLLPLALRHSRATLRQVRPHTRCRLVTFLGEQISNTAWEENSLNRYMITVEVTALAGQLNENFPAPSQYGGMTYGKEQYLATSFDLEVLECGFQLLWLIIDSRLPNWKLQLFVMPICLSVSPYSFH